MCQLNHARGTCGHNLDGGKLLPCPSWMGDFDCPKLKTSIKTLPHIACRSCRCELMARVDANTGTKLELPYETSPSGFRAALHTVRRTLPAWLTRRNSDAKTFDPFAESVDEEEHMLNRRQLLAEKVAMNHETAAIDDRVRRNFVARSDDDRSMLIRLKNLCEREDEQRVRWYSEDLDTQ